MSFFRPLKNDFIILTLVLFFLFLPVTFLSAESATLTRISFSTTSSRVESQGGFLVNIKLDTSSSQTVSVDYRTVSETALSGEDFEEEKGTITWQPGQTGKSIYIEVFNDRIVEGDETFSLVFSNPQNALFSGSMSKELTILDNDHVLSVDYTGNGKGTVSLNPPGGSYNSGTSVTLTAQSFTSCDFTGWSGNASGSELSTDITMDSDKTVEAGFALKTCEVDFELATEDTNHGSIRGNTTQTVNWNGTTTLVTAEANQGFHFHHWEGTGGFTSTSESLTISNVKADKNFTACFELDEGQHQETDLEEFTITSGDETSLIDEGTSLDLPEGLNVESLDMVSREGVMTINMGTVISGDVSGQIESRDAGEKFLQGVSFDITFESGDVETGLLPLEITMEISRDVLGAAYCEAIDMESQERGLSTAFLDHVGIIKMVSPDIYDLLEEAWETYPEEEAKMFFSISRDENSYYAGFNLLLADAKADSIEMTIQPVARSQDRYFLVLDGERDGHFKDPLLVVKKSVPEETGAENTVGCDAVMPLPALIVLVLPILALFSKKK